MAATSMLPYRRDYYMGMLLVDSQLWTLLSKVNSCTGAARSSRTGTLLPLLTLEVPLAPPLLTLNP